MHRVVESNFKKMVMGNHLMEPLVDVPNLQHYVKLGRGEPVEEIERKSGG